MKRYYDVDICKQVGNPEDADWETIETEAVDSRSEAIKRAKQYSLLKEWHGIPVFEAHVVCFTTSAESNYDPLYIRAYRNGEFVEQF